MSDAIPAATLVIMRDRTPGPPELLMVERARSMAFAGGAWVFPGGRVDPQDEALATALAPDLPDGAARVAAIRETLEETGVAIGFHVLTDRLAGIRTALHAGRPFGDVLAETGACLDLLSIVPFARWRPAHRPVRIFDTRFFLARAPADAVATVDRTENTRVAWTSAAALLARADAGKASIIYPTRRNLERLARFRDLAAAQADARKYPVRTIVPFVETRDATDYLCIPEGCGYPITAEPLADAVRG